MYAEGIMHKKYQKKQTCALSGFGPSSTAPSYYYRHPPRTATRTLDDLVEINDEPLAHTPPLGSKTSLL